MDTQKKGGEGLLQTTFFNNEEFLITVTQEALLKIPELTWQLLMQVIEIYLALFSLHIPKLNLNN